MEDLEADLRRLVERQAVEDTLLGYASTIDTKDYPALRALLCDDIRAQYGDVVVEGGDALVEWIDGATANKTWQHHLLSVYHVDFVSDTEARALTYHTSHQTSVDAPGRCSKIVARYHDTLRKEGGSWRIADKLMEIGWVEELRAPEQVGA